MTNIINETINAKESVLFIYGKLNEVTRQFTEMLRYCKKKNLHVVNIFFDTSNINEYQKECFNQLLNYLKHNKTKIAVVFYDRKEYNQCPWTHKLDSFMRLGQIELGFAKDNVILGTCL